MRDRLILGEKNTSFPATQGSHSLDQEVEQANRTKLIILHHEDSDHEVLETHRKVPVPWEKGVALREGRPLAYYYKGYQGHARKIRQFRGNGNSVN